MHSMSTQVTLVTWDKTHSSGLYKPATRWSGYNNYREAWWHLNAYFGRSVMIMACSRQAVSPHTHTLQMIAHLVSNIPCSHAVPSSDNAGRTEAEMHGS